jgi:hypothetical protein
VVESDFVMFVSGVTVLNNDSKCNAEVKGDWPGQYLDSNFTEVIYCCPETAFGWLPGVVDTNKQILAQLKNICGV